MVELLLSIGGVDPNSKDSEHGRTPLSWAAESGDEMVANMLLKNGAECRADAVVVSADKSSRTARWLV